MALEVEQLTESDQAGTRTRSTPASTCSPARSPPTPPYEQGPDDEYKGNAETVSRARRPGRVGRRSPPTSRRCWATAKPPTTASCWTRCARSPRTCGAAPPKTSERARHRPTSRSLDGNIETLTSCRRRRAARPTSSRPPCSRNEGLQTLDHREPVEHRRTRTSPPPRSHTPTSRPPTKPRCAPARRSSRNRCSTSSSSRTQERGASWPSHSRASASGPSRSQAQDVIEFPLGLIGLGGAALHAARPQPRNRVPVAARGRRSGACAAGRQPVPVLPEFLPSDRARGSRANRSRGSAADAVVRDGARDTRPARHHSQSACPAGDPARPWLPGDQHERGRAATGAAVQPAGAQAGRALPLGGRGVAARRLRTLPPDRLDRASIWRLLHNQPRC